MERLKIAVIGTGGRAGSHLVTIPKIKDRYELVAVCDISEERAKAASTLVGAPPFTNVVEMFDKAKPDVVLIAVPPEGHHTIVGQAAERGIHAISETPMSFSLRGAQQMLADAEKHGTLLEISENVRRWPRERFKRVVIDSGVLGEVTQIHCWYGSGMYHGISAIRNAARVPAVKVVGHLQHVQIGVERWFDPFVRRASLEDGRTPAAPAQPEPEARVATWELGVTTFENGIVSLHQYPVGRVRGNYWEIFLTHGEIAGNTFVAYDGRELSVEAVHTEVEGVQVLACLKLVGAEEEVVWENPWRSYPLVDEDDIARADVLLSIHRAATEGAPLDYGGIGGYRDLEMMIGARESALRGGGALTLPLDEAPLYDAAQHRIFREQYGHDPFEEVVLSDSWKKEANIAAELK